jgi:purine nucleoside phosphorylase
VGVNVLFRMIVPEDWFNPFDIMHMSHQYDAHIVPEVNSRLRQEILQVLVEDELDPFDGGVYIQTAGPRFETRAEVRFFKQFGVSFLLQYPILMNIPIALGQIGQL